MCGIAGWANLDPRTPPLAGGEELLRAMCDRMHHRGPDAEGYLIDRGVALGMRRLSVLSGVSRKSGDGRLPGRTSWEGAVSGVCESRSQ